MTLHSFCVQIGIGRTAVAFPGSQVKQILGRRAFEAIVLEDIGERFIHWAGSEVILGSMFESL